MDPPFQLSKIDFVTGSAEVIDDESAMAAAAAGEGGGVGEDEETIPRAWFLSKTGDGGVVKYDSESFEGGYLLDRNGVRGRGVDGLFFLFLFLLFRFGDGGVCGGGSDG